MAKQGGIGPPCFFAPWSMRTEPASRETRAPRVMGLAAFRAGDY